MYQRAFLFELTCWITALLLLFLLVPGEKHVTLCPFASLGLSWCPGCGIGRSISSFLHGHISESFSYHWFGIPATFILLHRILILTKKSLKSLHNLT